MLRYVVAVLALSFAGVSLAQESHAEGPDVELARLKAEYVDVLALTGTAKAEVIAIARLLRARPDMAIDRTAAAGEYCLMTGKGAMVHYASQPDNTQEDVLYEFDATQLLAAGLNPERMPRLPALGAMAPARWYFLPAGLVDPHHQHVMPWPAISLAINVK